MREKYNYLKKNVLLFSISGFVPKILAFILIPIYTNCLTTAEYGISDLIMTTVCLIIPIFTLDIQDAVMRFAFDEKCSKKDVFSLGLQTILKGGIFVTVIAAILSLIHIKGLNPIYLLFIVIMYFTTSCNDMFSLFCRGIEKVQVVAVSSIVNSVITLLSNIIFLVYFNWGLYGYLAANTIGVCVSLIYMFWQAKLYSYISFKITTRVKKEMICFSFPLIFSVISWWINNASDRYILTWMAGVSVSGVYAIAYKLPNGMAIFQNVFTQAWSISAIKEFDPNDTDGFIGQTYTFMNYGMILLCSGMMIANIPIAHCLYSKNFFEAWRYIPPLLVSVLFNAMALFIGSIFTAMKKTKTLSISTIVGAAANTICNFIFIYFWQAYGAAIATLIGYSVTFAMRYFSLCKYVRMKVKVRRDLMAYVLLIIQMVISNKGVTLIPLQIVIILMIIALYKKEGIHLINFLKQKLKLRKV